MALRSPLAFSLIALSLIGWPFTAAADCSSAIEKLFQPAQEYRLTDGSSYLWREPYTGEKVTVDIAQENGRIAARDFAVTGETEYELNFDLPSGKTPAEVIAAVFRQFYANPNPARAHVQSALGSLEFPARPHQNTKFSSVANIQRKQIFRLLVDGKEKPVLVRYEKTFSGRKIDDERRTQKLLVIKAYLPEKDGYARRLKTRFRWGGIYPAEENLHRAVAAWFRRVNSPWAERFQLERIETKITVREALDIYIGDERVGFISVDAQGPLNQQQKLDDQLRNFHSSVEIELFNSENPRIRAKVLKLRKDVQRYLLENFY